MSDWQTVRQQILTELGKPNDQELADLAMVESLRTQQRHRFWFNEDDWQVVSEADEFDYTLPDEVLYPIDGVNVTTADSVDWRPLTNKPSSWIRRNRYTMVAGGEIENSEINSGPPLFYGFDGNTLLINPDPPDDSYTFYGRCVVDYKPPVARYSPTSGWKIIDPVTDLELDPEFENPWLENAPDVIRAYAKYLMALRNYRDDKLVLNTQREWLEMVNVQKQLTVRKRSNRGVIGHLA